MIPSQFLETSKGKNKALSFEMSQWLFLSSFSSYNVILNEEAALFTYTIIKIKNKMYLKTRRRQQKVSLVLSLTGNNQL